MQDAHMELNKAVVVNLFAAINERRLDELGDYLAADVVDHNKVSGHGEPAPGDDAFDGIPSQLAAVDPYVVTVHELVAEGARVVARVTQRGIYRGAGDSDDRAFENQAAYFFSFADRKISEVFAVGDSS